MTILAIGPVALRKRLSATSPPADKQTNVMHGGSVVQASQSYYQATGDAPTVLAIIANEAARADATRALRREFSGAQAAVAERVCDTATSLMVQPYDWLLIASVEDNDGATLKELVNNSSATNTYWLPTDEQVQNLENFLSIGTQVNIVQLNARQARHLTDEEDVALAICKLRELGIRSVVVTSGDQGTFAYLNGQWSYAPAFHVQAACGTHCGDVLAGALIAALQRNDECSVALRQSAAAAALRFQTGRCGGTPKELARFAATTPVRRLSRTTRGNRQTHWHRRLLRAVRLVSFF